MEAKRSIWKETLNYGIILGLISVGLSVLTYMFDLTFRTWIMWPTILINIVILYLLLRSYRDHYNNGYITYGKSVGAGVIISLYAMIISAIYIYVLYAFIDPGLTEKSLAFAEERIRTRMAARGLPEGSLDSMMARQAKMMTPWFTSLMAVINGVFTGLIMSLIVSLFVMKSGNPLLEETVEEPKQ